MAFSSATVSVGAVTRQSDYQRVMDNTVFNKQQLAITNDLTSDNITHTLPAITGLPQMESIYWTDGGTYKLTLAVSDSETVGGIAAGTWLGEGEGHMVVESDGTNWQVREYEDNGSIADSGGDTDRVWYKTTDGVLRLEGARAMALAGIAGLAFTVTFGKTFSVAPVVSADNLIGYGVDHFLSAGVQTIATTTTVLVRCHDTTATARTGSWNCPYRAIGRWRT